MSSGISMRNLKAVKNQLDRVGQELRPKLMRSAMRAAFKPVYNEARARAPVLTHALREGITLAWAKGKVDTEGAVGLVVVTTSTRAKQARMAAAAFGEAQSKALPPARRWHFIELGTAHHMAKPFLRPALHNNKQSVVDTLAQQLKKKVDSAIRRAAKGKK